MPSFVPLQSNNPAHQAYVPPTGYPAARTQSVAAVGRGELARAVPAMPLGFQRTPQGVMLVAVLGLSAERNLFVTADDRWAGGYVPAVFRSWPFALGATPEGKTLLCIEESAGTAAGTAGARALFDEAAQPTPFVKQLLSFLSQVQADLGATQKACGVLDEHGLLTDWEITVKAGDQTIPLQGLLKVDEAALNRCEPATLGALRDAGALPLAYGQLFSMVHLAMLGKLAEAHAQAAEKMRARMRETAEMFQGDDEVTFNFD
jgi:hypothetical protein